MRAGGRGLGAALLVAALLAAPEPAHAETVQISGSHLRLQSTGDPAQMQNLHPGVPVIWQVGVWAEAPEPGQIDLALTGRGALAEAGDAVTISVRSCPEPWTAGRCGTGSRELLAAESLDRVAASGLRHLVSFSSDEQRWLRIAVELSDDSPRLAGADADVLLRATGVGDQIEAGPDDPGDGSDSPGGAGSGTRGPGEEAPGEEGSDAARADAMAEGTLARTGAVGIWALLAAALLTTTLGIALRGGASRRPEGRGGP
jgi:signal peptidase